MNRGLAAVLTLIVLGCGEACASDVRLVPPEHGVYHAAHPDFGLRDDFVTAERVRRFVSLAEKDIVWSFVGFHWDRGIIFPTEACKNLHKEGVVPLIGFMPWSTLTQSKPEPLYTLGAILSGVYDDALRACAREVRSLGFPIMIEFGPEANGSWFPWSGAWNGRDEDAYGEAGYPDGPERFRDSYRHVVQIFRDEGVRNVTWVFHLAQSSAPDALWNAAAYYYPGDEWVDWIGVSLYGKLRRHDDVKPFEAMMLRIYPELAALSRTKPIAILELGVADDHEGEKKARWIEEALSAISAGKYPRVKAVSWWNKTRRPDGTRSMLEIDSSPASLSAYREGVRGLIDQANWSPRQGGPHL